MKKTETLGYAVMGSVGFLLLMGIIVIASVSSVPAQQKLDAPYYYLGRHIAYILIGLTLGFLAFKIKLDFFKKYALTILLVNIALLVATLKFGFSSGGATRWLAMGPIMIQPAEFIKLTFIIYFALWLSKKSGVRQKKKKKSSSGSAQKVLIFALFSVTGILLILQPDISNLAILFSVLMIIYFLAGASIWHIFFTLVAGIAGLFAIIKLAPYRIDRLSILLNPDLDPMGKGYQIKQALIAIGSGGLFGLGLGMSRQKLGFLPEAMTDAIFAVFTEETGFLGGALMILLYIAFLWAGLLISKRVSDKFASLLAAGITFWITIQAFVNMGAMLRLLPLMGIALPFISYGGSHLVAELIGMGILLNIYKNKT